MIIIGWDWIKDELSPIPDYFLPTLGQYYLRKLAQSGSKSTNGLNSMKKKC